MRPDLKRGSFSAQEERIIIDIHRVLGNRWAQIAKHLPGRTDNEVKNFWNSCIKKKLIAQGLDPKTHHVLHPNDQVNHTTANACTLSHIHQSSTALLFSSDTEVMKAGKLGMKSPFMILPPPFPPLDTSYSFHPSSLGRISSIPSFESQDHNYAWTTNVNHQSQQAMMELMNRSTTGSTQITTRQINPFGLEVLEDNYMWEAIASLDPRKQVEGLQQQQQEKACEVQLADDPKELGSGEKMDNSLNGSSFDLELVEYSGVMPCGTGMYCSSTSSSCIDQLAWGDC